MPKTLNFKSTKDIKVSEKIADQVIGQEHAVKIIKKAAKQKRHVLLIGEPGTGKSMLGLALAELLSKEKLVDILSFYNPNDENQPLIRTVPAGKGRELIAKSKLQNMGFLKSQNLILLVLVIISMIAPWWVRSYYKSDVMFAAFFIGGMFFLVAFVIFINMNKRMIGGQKGETPKLIVDNYQKKRVPFFDATGAHAGSLLGDVLHDPFQSLSNGNKITIVDDKNVQRNVTAKELIDNLFDIHSKDILKKKEKNYEAIHLPKNKLFVLGETNSSVSKVEVLSSNRYDYDGEMIKLTTSENKELIVTPEHKIAVQRNGKITYVEAKEIMKGDEVITKSEDIIIDEQDIINTYDERQQEQCKLYYQYLDVKNKNSTWGYKRLLRRLMLFCLKTMILI